MNSGIYFSTDNVTYLISISNIGLYYINFNIFYNNYLGDGNIIENNHSVFLQKDLKSNTYKFCDSEIYYPIDKDFKAIGDTTFADYEVQILDKGLADLFNDHKSFIEIYKSELVRDYLTKMESLLISNNEAVKMVEELVNNRIVDKIL